MRHSVPPAKGGTCMLSFLFVSERGLIALVMVSQIDQPRPSCYDVILTKRNNRYAKYSQQYNRLWFWVGSVGATSPVNNDAFTDMVGMRKYPRQQQTRKQTLH